MNEGKNARDTQFQDFAKVLLKELLDDVLDEYGFFGGREHYPDLNHDLNICEAIIARRTYDLAKHTVIELKPDKKYLLVFKDTDREVLDIISNILHRSGFDCLCIAVSKDEDLQIIETPAKTEQ